MFDVEIRRARRNEAREAFELLQLAVAGGAAPVAAGRAAANDAVLEATCDLSRVHLVTLDAMPAGMVMSGEAAASNGDARGWRIEALAVHPEYHGLGLGRRLMRVVETLALAHEVEEISLELAAAAQARPFFAGQGFRSTPASRQELLRLAKPLVRWTAAAA